MFYVTSWKDATQYPMAFEPLSKPQKQLHFHLFWDELKMDYISVFFISFSSKSMLVASISCICNCKLFCSHLYDY